MKPRKATALQLWMRENMYSDQALADRLTLEGEVVSAASVRKWRLGTTMPRRGKLIAINKITDGKVAPGSFAEA